MAKKAVKSTATKIEGTESASNLAKTKILKKATRTTTTRKASPTSKTLRSKDSKSNKKTTKSLSFDPGSIVSFDDLPEEQDLSMIGLIAPDGNGGGSLVGKAWTFSTNLIAWKVQGGSIVRESALVVCRNVSERRLDALMNSVSNLDIITFTAKRPKKSLRPKTYPQPKRFELNRFGRKSVDAELLNLKSELQAPVQFRDTVFGTLKLDRQFHMFRAETSFRGTDMCVSFQTMNIDELKDLIKYAKSLWKQRQAWFTNWQRKVYQYYTKGMSGWWEEDYELTEATFYKLLGWPVGVEFSSQKGKLGYSLGGWSEELFTDHGIDATGTTIDDMKANF